MQYGSGDHTPFGPQFLWAGRRDTTVEAAETLYGYEISRSAYAGLVFPFVVRCPETPYLDVGGIEEINKLPIWLAEELFNLLPKQEEETIGEVKTSG